MKTEKTNTPKKLQLFLKSFYSLSSIVRLLHLCINLIEFAIDKRVILIFDVILKYGKVLAQDIWDC